MNSVHDMGGMHGMGPIVEERNEPVFHDEWEGRIFAMNLAMGAWRKWNIDASRHAREMIPPAEYLRMTYYERWVSGLVELIVKSGLATRDEIESATPAAGSAKAVPAANPNQALARIATGLPAKRNVDVPARFKVGQRVRTHNMHPVGHTRLPRYARGRSGPSTVTMVFLFSRTPMLISSVSARSTFIRYALLRASCGALRQGRKILCT